MNKMLLAAAAATSMLASAAYAAVSFDYTAGTGFVGKGDIQLAYGWNNATMQRNHLAVDFYVESTADYEVVCEWTTETGGRKSKKIIHNKTKKFNVSDTAAVDATSRKTGQYTGWNLNGYPDGGPASFEIPQLGEACPQGGVASDNDPIGNDAQVIESNFTSEPISLLYAIFNGDARPMPNTPIIVTTTTL